MNQISSLLIRNSANYFIQKFYQQFKKEIAKFKQYKLDPNKFIPKIFMNDFGVEVIFSIDKGHFMIVFNDYINVGHISYKFVKNDVVEAFDITGQWSSNNSSVAINVGNGRNISLKNVDIKGLKPLSLDGNDIEVYIDNNDFHLPIGTKRKIQYAMVFSFQVLIDFALNIEDFTNNFIYAYWSYYDKYKEKLDPTADKYDEFIADLESIKLKMKYFFYDENVLERDIEKFIKENPIIITRILGLENPIYQADLKDIKGIYKQQLRPDLMGFDQIRDNWTIVDYKLGRGTNLIKSPGGVRVKFNDSVAKLEAQLRIYRKYFNESDHREYFNKKYKTTIHELPHTIGIIGYVDNDSRKDFNELMDDKNRWFDVIPYNDLETKLEQFISTLRSIS